MNEVSSPSEEIRAYENPYALPLGYMADADICGFNINATSDAFEAQNKFFSDLLGKDTVIYNMIDVLDTKNVNLIESPAGGQTKYAKGGGPQAPYLEYTVDAPAGQDVYMWITAYTLGRVSVTADSREIGEYFGEPSYILPLGKAGSDGKLTVRLEPREQDFHIGNAYFAALNFDVFENAVSDLKENGFNITEWSQTKLKGTVTAKKKGVFFTTIPFEPGWNAEVDGQKVETYSAANAFLAFDVPAGRHEIKLTFMPKEVVFGSAVSCCGFLILILLLIRNRKRRPVMALPNGSAESAMTEAQPTGEMTAEDIPEAVQPDEPRDEGV